MPKKQYKFLSYIRRIKRNGREIVLKYFIIKLLNVIIIIININDTDIFINIIRKKRGQRYEKENI